MDSKLNDLPKDLPKDLRSKFEIHDAPALSPQPVVAAAEPRPVVQPTDEEEPIPTRVTIKKKSREKSKGVSPQASQGGRFAYPERRPVRDPIWLDEQEVYEITYFGMSAGDFILNVLPYKRVGDRKVYHVRGTAVSSKVFSLFYRLNDMVETFIDYDGLFSHRFHILLDETKQERDSVELYDSEKKQTFFWNRWNRKQAGYTESKTFSPMASFSQDSLSSLYYLRTVPLPDGAVVSFPVVSEGNTWEAVCTVVRREILDTPMGRVKTIVLKPETKYQGVLKKNGGDSFIWLTDDDRRVLVRLEAKVRVGTIVATLKKFSPGTAPSSE